MAVTSGGPDGPRPQTEEQILELLPQFMFVMVPAFALIVMLVMRKSGRTYPQHGFRAPRSRGSVRAHRCDSAVDLVTAGRKAFRRGVLTVAHGFVALRTAYGGGWGRR